MNEVELYIGELALELVPVFSGSEEQSAKWFIRELEEALDLSNITIDKYKKYYFKEKLKGLPLQWYESVRDDDDYQSMTWDLLKKKFLKEFDTKELRLKDTIRLLMNCCQNKEENVRSYYIRITKLFNEFKQISGKSLNKEEEVEYFINGVLPICKLQLNNRYQNDDGSYFNILLKEVLETASMLERNGIVYEAEMNQLSSEERTNENELQGCCYKKTDNNTIDSQMVQNELIIIRDEEIEKKLDRCDNLQKEVDVISSESCNNTGLSINGVNSKSTVRQDEEVELDEDIGKEEGIYNIKCESEKEINESDVNYNSVNKGRKKDSQLMDFKVKSDGCYNYCEEERELEDLEINKEEKIMLVMRKEPKPPWKIILLTDQEEKRNNICC